MPIDEYLRTPVCNGHPREQALIRRWWHEVQGGRGRMIWEYYLGDCYLDAMWLPEAKESGAEASGGDARKGVTLSGVPVVLCEAKLRLTPELIGQALLYTVFARRAGAQIRSTVIFAETARPEFKSAAEELGLEVVLP
jgi:hypothetical protein